MGLIKLKLTSQIGLLLLLCMVMFNGNITASTSFEKLLYQDNIETSNPPFKIESISGKYKIIKAELKDCIAIFRSDRIELLYKNSKQKEASTYLLFPKACKAEARGQGLHESTTEPIANIAMANVIGQKNMDVQYFEQIIYPNIYPGTDLIISKNGDELEIILEGNNTDFSLSLLDSNQQNKMSNGVLQLNRFEKTIEIKAKNADVKWNNSKDLNFSKKAGYTGKTSFGISVK